jgi:non-specific serine/threonine protein kinase
MSSLIGKTILHYRILEQVGQGGMGVVYLAEDTRLERKVAIKFLPRHIAANVEERQRFEIEAKAAAALNHPNIATIHAIEETDNEIFIVMEYIEGRGLREIIQSEIPNLQSAIDYATQVAKGLQAAHEKDIVHRDIKSSNIMVTESGQVKIMDFGLVKMHDRAQEINVGITMGTAAYMSPEQARGEAVDPRSDIWSLGVVLYEMLTGKLPFGGEYVQAIFYAIINENPQPVSDYRQDVPASLEGIVKKALAKNRDERYQSIREVLADLQQAINQPDSGKVPARQRLAVFPFDNLSNDPQTDFLSFALADQIIGKLVYFKNILVRPSSAIRKYQNLLIDARTAGKELEVDYVLNGNYLKDAGVVRLNIELVEVHSNEITWREGIEVEYENAFKLQDIVARQVLEGFKVQFSQDEQKCLSMDVPQNPLAYEYYLRGVSYPFNVDGARLAIEMLNKSIQLDPTYAPAYSELGFRLRDISFYAIGEAESVRQAEEAFLKALSLNDKLLSALGNLAAIYAETGKIEKALELVRRALRINPNSAGSHFSLSYIYRYAGMLEESAKEGETAIALYPRNPRFRSVGGTYTYLGKYDRALQLWDLDAESAVTLAWKGSIYLRLGKPEVAEKYFNRAIKLEPSNVISLWAAVMKAHVEGNQEDGLAVLRKLEQSNLTDGEQWYNIGALYGLLGDSQGCARMLRKAVDLGFFNYPFMLRDSFLDSVRNDPGIQQVLKKSRKKHDAFKKQFFSDQN